MVFKRILLISHEMTYTGAPKSLLMIAKLLRSHGNYVKVATLRRGPFEREYLKHGFIVRHYDEESYNYSLLKQKQDLVIANTIFTGKFAIKAQEYVPTLLYIREAQNLPILMSENNLSPNIIYEAENIICVSEYAEDFIKNTYFPKNIFVLHNFIDNAKLIAPPPNISLDGKIHFLMAGTIETRKGYHIAINAIDNLPAEISNRVVLHIAGRVPEWSVDYYNSLELHKRSYVTYHGEISNPKEMTKLYQSANVVLVPSLDESCSLVALEGAMHGKYLIISENVGAKYIITSNGIVVPTNDAKELTNAIINIAQNKKLIDTSTVTSYKNFMNTSNKKNYYQGFHNIYKTITKSKSKQKRSTYEQN